VDKKKFLQGFSDTFGAKYDSDKDLTLREQKAIKNSKNSGLTREQIWELKGNWKKLKKGMKSAYYGDKRAKKKAP